MDVSGRAHCQNCHVGKSGAMVVCATPQDSTSSCHQKLAALASKEGQLLENLPVQKCANECYFFSLSSAVWAHTITKTLRKNKWKSEEAPPWFEVSLISMRP